MATREPIPAAHIPAPEQKAIDVNERWTPETGALQVWSTRRAGLLDDGHIEAAPHGARQLRAYPVNADGTLGAGRILHDFGPHRGIDGMRTDAAGNIVATCGWDASGPGPRIAVFAPDGTVLAEHPTPTNPTNCAFGDTDRRTLYVTGYDGCLYRARTDLEGLIQG